ncbi:MAG TPA: HAD family phosphatase [Solirubrobacteraceae bacterium]|jgi:HAD superfamily phosphoserine phosphatase-like hydrolase
MGELGALKPALRRPINENMQVPSAPQTLERSSGRAARPTVQQFLFDLDGTVTRVEILPEIARAIGLEREIAELTRETMAGGLPFESSLRRRVEILRQVPVSEVRAIVRGVELDGHVVDFLSRNRDRCTIVTGNLDVWVGDLIADLGVPCYCSTAEVDGDRLVELTSVLDKATVTANWLGPICAVGDGYNDLGMIAAADLGVAYGGVHAPAPGLLDVATHAIYDSRRLCDFLSAW